MTRRRLALPRRPAILKSLDSRPPPHPTAHLYSTKPLPRCALLLRRPPPAAPPRTSTTKTKGASLYAHAYGLHTLSYLRFRINGLGSPSGFFFFFSFFSFLSFLFLSFPFPPASIMISGSACSIFHLISSHLVFDPSASPFPSPSPLPFLHWPPSPPSLHRDRLRFARLLFFLIVCSAGSVAHWHSPYLQRQRRRRRRSQRKRRR